MPTPADTIDLCSDSDDSDLICTGQFRRVQQPIVPKKRESTAPRVPVQPTGFINLVDDDSDNDMHRGPSIATTSTARDTPENRALTEAIQAAQEQHRQAIRAQEAAQPMRSDTPKDPPISISDSDEEDYNYAAFDLNYSGNWEQGNNIASEEVPARDIQKEITGLSEEMALLMPVSQRERGKAAVNMLFKVPAISSFKAIHIPRREGKKDFPWKRLQRDAAAADRADCKRKVACSFRRKPSILAARFLAAGDVRAGFSPGSVNSIAQTDGLIAVASCTLGGGADEEDDSGRNLPYNNAGSLKVISNDNVFTLHGHEGVLDVDQPGTNSSQDTSEGNHRTKHYTVNEVHFDPTDPTRLVSCGRDKKIIIWDCDTRDSKPMKMKSHHYKHVPEGLQFKLTGSTFVSWTSAGEVGIHNGIDEPNMVRCTTKPEPIQSVLWGRGTFQHMVYLTTQVDVGKRCSGKHLALDVEYSKTTPFSRKLDGGETLDINSTGTRLAHVTCGNNRIFKLSIYDTQTGDYARAQEITLPPFVSNPNNAGVRPSVQQVLFSPDSVYLAVARSDNITHVYDSRFLNQSFLYEFPHGPAVEASEDDKYYGIPKIEWLEDRTHGLSLVSCGADGCVRLWDMKRASNPYADTVIAKSVSYAGWFSLGDMSRGEKALILGDGSGNLVIKE